MTDQGVQSIQSDEGFTVTSTTQSQDQLKAQFNKTPEEAKKPPVDASEPEEDVGVQEEAETAPEGDQKGADGKPQSRHKSPTARVQYATRIAAEAKKERDEIEQRYKEAQAELEKLRGPKTPAMPSMPAEAKPEAAQSNGRPKQEDFTDYDQWQEALMDWKIEQRESNTKVQQERELALQHQEKTFHEFQARVKERVESGRDDNLTPEAIALVPRGALDFSKKLSNDEVLGWYIVSEKTGIDLLKHVSDNPVELQRLRGLGQGALLIELGRLDGRLSSAITATEPKTTQISRAAPPVRPVTASAPSGEDDLDGSEPFEVYAKKRMRQMDRERKAQLG